MKINRKELVNVLEKVAPALGFNVLVPEFQYFQILGDKIQASDGAMLIDAILPKDTELNCAVPGAPFLHLLKTLSDEEVELIDKDNTLKVKTNRVKGVFTISGVAKFKDTINLLQKGIIEITGDLNNLIKGFSFCRFAVSKDETSGPLCGVRISKSSIFGTDRYRIIEWMLAEDLPIECSLPLKLIDVIIKFRNQISNMYYSKNGEFILMLKDGTYISSVVLVGEYPDLGQYFPTSDQYKEVELTDNLTDVLERHISFLKNVNEIEKEITIRICRNKCTISSVDKELGTLSEEVEVTFEEEEGIEFCVNPIFLRDIVKECSGFKYYYENGLVLFEADKLEYLVQVRK